MSATYYPIKVLASKYNHTENSGISYLTPLECMRQRIWRGIKEGGILWRSSWIWEFESPLSILKKIKYANYAVEILVQNHGIKTNTLTISIRLKF